jgi:hypothetical protein
MTTLACRTCGDRVAVPPRSSLTPDQAECRPCRFKRRKRVEKAERPALPPIACAQCGEPFEPKRPNQKYCTVECRARRHRQSAGWQRNAGTTTERGYGAGHQRERKKWRAIVDAGNAHCCLCGTWLPPGAPFDLDHTPDRTGYRGAACPSCNRSDGASRARRQR